MLKWSIIHSCNDITILSPFTLIYSHHMNMVTQIQQRLFSGSNTKHIIKYSEEILGDIACQKAWRHHPKSRESRTTHLWSLDYDGLQPAQHLLKSQSSVGTEFQYCDWLSSRCDDVIHSKQWFHLYQTHSAWHVTLVEQNKHRGAVQRQSGKYWQQLDAGRGYLSNVGWVHYENDRGAVFEVTWPYWAHAASQLS